MIKNFLEAKHGITIVVKRRLIPIEDLRPTQHEVYADELFGRMEEIKRGLVEPIIVIQKKDHYILVDGHHRALASKKDGRETVHRIRARAERRCRARFQRSADERNLHTLDDVKIIDGSHHPLIEITTRFMKDELTSKS